MRKIFLTTCCLSLFLRPEISEAFGYTASMQYDELADPNANKDILKNLKGLAIVAPSTQLTSGELDHVEGVWIDSALGLPGNEDELVSTMQKSIGHPLTQLDLQEIRSSIARYYQEHSTPVITVVVPSQDISNGVLQIVIVEGRLGEIKTRGNRWTSDNRLVKGLDIKSNERINSYLMQRNLAWLNRNPFRTTDAVLAAGEEPGTTDIELVTKERFPFRPYAGADNTGVPETGRTRWYAGFNAGDLFGQDHQASYQFTGGADLSTFLAHSGSYLIPFSWRHELLFFGGYAKVKGNLSAPSMKNNGKVWQVSGRYGIPINPIFGNLLQQVSFGYDFKRTNSSIEFGGQTQSSSYADINQFVLIYTLDYAGQHSKTSLVLEAFGAPFRITKDQNDSAYQKIRPFAQAEYAYARGSLSYTQYLPRGFVIKGIVAGQGTGWNLMPSEQYGLGGYDTVRGYNERAYNADDAFSASLELMSCDIDLFVRLFNKKNREEHFQFITFIDYGVGVLHHPSVGDKETAWLLGVGPGLRYQYDQNVMFRADVGFPLHREGFGNKIARFHVGGTIAF